MRSENRSRGWKFFWGAIFVMFFIGGRGLWGMPYFPWDSTMGKIEVTAFIITALTGLTGLYKIITGR
jgi:hypothetical protein